MAGGKDVPRADDGARSVRCRRDDSSTGPPGIRRIVKRVAIVGRIDSERLDRLAAGAKPGPFAPTLGAAVMSRVFGRPAVVFFTRASFPGLCLIKWCLGRGGWGKANSRIARCTGVTEVLGGSGLGYKVARRNGWLRDHPVFMHRSVVPRGRLCSALCSLAN
jgi:hypothetical protein